MPEKHPELPDQAHLHLARYKDRCDSLTVQEHHSQYRNTVAPSNDGGWQNPASGVKKWHQQHSWGKNILGEYIQKPFIYKEMKAKMAF
jgi:hypothetical protein